MENVIKLKKEEGVLKVGIIDPDGNIVLDEKGKEVFISFDLEDIEMPLRIAKCEAGHKNNLQSVRLKLAAIDKKENIKNGGLLSSRDREKIEAVNEFYAKEIANLDLFLGEGGCIKLLNGRKPYYDMFDDFFGYLQPHIDKFEQIATSIEGKIKEKYKDIEEENEVLE